MNVLDAIGNGMIQGLAYVGGLTMQFWSELRDSPRVLPFMGRRGRWKTAMRQMAAIGVDGLPIISIMSVCAGFILAMQTGSVLRKFGALQYVMDVVGVGFTREIGPLLTALIVCGRSGSAFSAEIGTMVVTSEIDAMKTMAIDPIELVLTPKYIAAMITLPCLTIMSNTFGILAGAVFMYITTKITTRDVFAICLQLDRVARRPHRTAKEPHLRDHYCECRLHGGTQGTRWSGCSGAFSNIRRGQVHIPRDSGRRIFHCDFLSGA